MVVIIIIILGGLLAWGRVLYIQCYKHLVSSDPRMGLTKLLVIRVGQKKKKKSETQQERGSETMDYYRIIGPWNKPEYWVWDRCVGGLLFEK